MHPHPVWELLPIQSAHAHFVNWERAKHRADFFAAISFPDSHPLRVALWQASRDLEQHRWAADVTITDLAREHGTFSAHVNGYHFEKAADWFRSADDYSDCPKIRIGKHVRRSKSMFLAGVASIHDVERSGRAFAEAVTQIVSRVRPKAKDNLVRTAKLFDKDCRRLERALQQVKICARDRAEVLLCLQHKGLPAPLATAVLEFLV